MDILFALEFAKLTGLASASTSQVLGIDFSSLDVLDKHPKQDGVTRNRIKPGGFCL